MSTSLCTPIQRKRLTPFRSSSTETNLSTGCKALGNCYSAKERFLVVRSQGLTMSLCSQYCIEVSNQHRVCIAFLFESFNVALRKLF